MSARKQMNRLRSMWVIVFALAVCISLSARPRFVHADGMFLVGPDGKRLQLRGTNLSNWLVPEGYMFGLEGDSQSPREIEGLFNELVGPDEAAQFWHSYRDAYITENDIRFLHQNGMNSIRIPLHYKFFEPGNNEGFALLDRVVGWARKYDIYVILDMHCAPGGQTGMNIDDSWGYPWLFESAADQQETIRIWRRIAEHYRDNPTILGYDLLNEPAPDFPIVKHYNSSLEPLYKTITSEVRKVDSHHVIILGGARWDMDFDVFGRPFDQNVMYTFHWYNNPPTEEGIQKYLGFRARYGVPIWLGESGENTDTWIHDFTVVLEKNQVGWAFWPYKKMEKSTSFVSWQKPAYWDEIVTFAKTRESTADVTYHLIKRPSLEHSRAALQDLLQRIQFIRCSVNGGYIGALARIIREH